MSGTALHRRHGAAGLLVALFVVAGLVFSYGLGHAPPPRVCTEHAVSAPAGPSSGTTGHEAAPHGLAGAALSAPAKPHPHLPLDVCLCVAVLFTLLLIALLTGLRRPLSRLPARAGWSLAPPPGAATTLAFPPVLQVLRL
ncbi:hypothetical protein [Actinomadura monticuli]|uniref:DUF2946 domain-containing protein n=1 Tax=Actinomadura monticuli TaxID=3097367 RepID=A0ABV4QLK4_9ACTN